MVTVFWADWGVFGDGAGCQAKLSAAELRLFIAFARDRLAKACTDERLRVVASGGDGGGSDRNHRGPPRGSSRSLRGGVGAPHAGVGLQGDPAAQGGGAAAKVVEYLKQADCAPTGAWSASPRASQPGKTGGRYHETVEAPEAGPRELSGTTFCERLESRRGPASDPFR